MLVALLVDPDDHSHDFIEIVARNSGHDFTLFRDHEQVINHLLEFLKKPLFNRFVEQKA